jgi:hypothetical protein
MRRMLAAVGLIIVTVAFGAACTSGSAGTDADGTTTGERAGGNRGAAAVPAAGPGSGRSVCSAIRTAITADMAPFGTALGSVVGSIVGKDTKRHAQAVRAVDVALRKIGTDIATASAPAVDAPIRLAAEQAVAQVNVLAADPTYLMGVDSMSDIPALTARLTDATASIASACQGS